MGERHCWSRRRRHPSPSQDENEERKGEAEMRSTNSTKRLTPGTAAPDFHVTTVQGKEVNLSDYRGRRLLLSFYRFATCPFCNLRVHRLLQKRAAYQARNLELLAVFPSREELLLQYVSRQDERLPIISDPERRLYQAYGIETSIAGILRALPLRLADAALAMSKGFPHGEIDADKTTIPADFLIDEAGILRVPYYGRDIADHLPLDRIESYLAAHPSSHTSGANCLVSAPP